MQRHRHDHIDIRIQRRRSQPLTQHTREILPRGIITPVLQRLGDPVITGRRRIEKQSGSIHIPPLVGQSGIQPVRHRVAGQSLEMRQRQIRQTLHTQMMFAGQQRSPAHDTHPRQEQIRKGRERSFQVKFSNTLIHLQKGIINNISSTITSGTALPPPQRASNQADREQH